jgi:hypothetical protein
VIIDVFGERAKLPVHLQARIVEVRRAAALPPFGADRALVEAQVIRVFRGPASAGDTLHLTLRIKRDGESTPPGDFEYDWDAVATAKFIEVFLGQSADGLWLPSNSYSELLSGTSELPVLEQRASRDDRPWWRKLLGIG